MASNMTVEVCRSIGIRNLSISSTSIPKPSNISDAEWVTNIISLIIFVSAFIGNTAALVVMFGNRGPIRLTNNKYLANLACADLLRACFMPFTIIARMKRNFMFGKMICKILPIVQGLSVAVDVFSLICISIERYLAICHPLLILNLRSVRFATLANGLILFSIWSLGLLIALPNLYMYNLCSLPKLGRFKCEKTSPKGFDERFYMIAVDTFYFVIPMLVMIVLYTSIIWKMYRNSTAKKMRSVHCGSPSNTHSASSTMSLSPFHKFFRSRSMNRKSRQAMNYEKFLRFSSDHTPNRLRTRSSGKHKKRTPQANNLSNKQQYNLTRAASHPIPRVSSHNINLSSTKMQRFRSLNSSKNCNSPPTTMSRIDRHRRKALKLLITLIVEFFVCWTPLFIFHTIGTFDKAFYRSTPNVCVDLILLFSFASASCNPLTYYFMSKRYRSVLYAYLPCCFLKKKSQIFINQRNPHTRHLSKAFHSSEQRNSSDKRPSQINKI